MTLSAALARLFSSSVLLGIEGGEQESFKALWQVVAELPSGLAAPQLPLIVWRAGEGRVQMTGQRPSGTSDAADEVGATPGPLVVRPCRCCSPSTPPRSAKPSRPQ